MQIPKKQKIYIPAIIIMMAIIAVVISPMSSAIAQESSDGNSSDHNPDEKSYDKKDGKSCADKNKEGSETTDTSGEQA